MPYAEYGLTYDFQIIVQTAQGLRPSIPEGAPLDFINVFQACVDAVPSKRPTATQIAEMLRVRFVPSVILVISHFVVGLRREVSKGSEILPR